MSGTTYTAFQPSPLTPFTFQPVLDGQSYNLTVTWLLGGNRYYVNLYDQSGDWIFTLPLIGSPPDYNISLTAGYFTTSLVYRAETGNFEISG